MFLTDSNTFGPLRPTALIAFGDLFSVNANAALQMPLSVIRAAATSLLYETELASTTADKTNPENFIRYSLFVDDSYYAYDILNYLTLCGHIVSTTGIIFNDRISNFFDYINGRIMVFNYAEMTMLHKELYNSLWGVVDGYSRKE